MYLKVKFVKYSVVCIAQLVECFPSKQEVPGSIPGAGIFIIYLMSCDMSRKHKQSVIWKEHHQNGDIIDQLILLHPRRHRHLFELFRCVIRIIPYKTRSHNTHGLFITDELPQSVRSYYHEFIV